MTIDASIPTPQLQQRDVIRDIFRSNPVYRTRVARVNSAQPEFIYDVDEERYSDLRSGVSDALDSVKDLKRGDDASKLTSELMSLLQALKLASSERIWRNVIVPAAREHEIKHVVHECPFTRHSYNRPRGYPGDAGLIDFVYRHPSVRPIVEAATAVGRSVMDLAVNVAACEAVRQRKDVIARTIDETAETNPKPEVLAVACGHLRELESSAALQAGEIGFLLATDQDDLSLDEVARCSASISSRVEIKNISVRKFISSRHGLGRFDLIYAAGLYDYLDARVASRLTGSLFNLLKPGGKLLVPNLLVGIPEEAYMEVFMNWPMVYRTRDQIEAFAADVQSDAREVRYDQDASGTIGYLTVGR